MSTPQAIATVRFNREETLCEASMPCGEEYGPVSLDDELIVFSDAGVPGYVMFLANQDGTSNYDGLEPNVVYKLVPVSTVVETVDDFDDDDGEEESDATAAPEPGAPQ